MNDIERDYDRPLKEIFDSFPGSTQSALKDDIRRIWTYFSAWCFYIIISLSFAITLVFCIDFGLNLPDRIQRVGSIVPFLAVAGEAIFIVRLNKLVSVIHPAQLTFEIYKQRRFKWLVYFSLAVTLSLAGAGAIFSGYGDLIFEGAL